MLCSAFKNSNSIFKLLKMIMRAFYSDLHIVTIDILINFGYASEFSIAKELKIPIEKIKMVINNLNKENFIKFEERLFKQIKSSKKKKNEQRIYKLRYWYIDFNFSICNIKENIKKIFLIQKTITKKEEDFFLICSRKICKKKFSIKDLPSLPYNQLNGKFNCNNFLNLRVICGGGLLEINNLATNLTRFDLLNFEKKFIINELKPIIILILSSIKNVRF